MNIKELIQYIQSANINFMIGSGASRPFLATLGSIEIWLTKLAENKKSKSSEFDIVEASIYKAFYDSVISPNVSPHGESFNKTRANYKALLSAWNGIMNKRYSRLLNKQVNLFSTNVDLMVEYASSGMGIELNDGFKGSVIQIYDETNFMQSVNQTSLHFQYTSEIPVFNLLKIHGSINWSQYATNVISNSSSWNIEIDEALKNIEDDRFIDVHYVDNGIEGEKTFDQLVDDAKSVKVTDTSIYRTFLEAYQKLIIVNPTKRKFEQTVMDYHFYELMRIYANALEKENTLLFVIGFSFADEHIATITKRAADSNPTLKIIVFAFNDDEETSFKQKLGMNPICLNNNITILTPASFKASNQDDEYKEFANTIEHFDLETVSKLFSFIEKNLH